MIPSYRQQLPSSNAGSHIQQHHDMRAAHHDTGSIHPYPVHHKDMDYWTASTGPQRTEQRIVPSDPHATRDIIRISSFRRFPADVLSEVFMNVPTSPNSAQRNSEVLTLCHILSWWRSVAISTPHLWTALHIALPSETASYDIVEPIKTFVSTWFGRTGTILPLALRLQVKTSAEMDEVPTNRPNSCLKLLNGIIKPYAHRLKHIDFDSWFIYPLLLPFLSQTEPFINAVSLVLRAGKDDRYPVHQHESPDAPKIFPNLTRAKFERDLLATDPPFFPLPWQQLTHLTINYLRCEYWLDVLTMCPNLEFGDFNLPGDVYDHVGVDQNITTPIPLHNLKELILTFIYAFDPYVFYRLEMPNLTTLRLGASAEDDQGVWMWRKEPGDVFHAIASVRRLALIKEWPLCTYMFTMLLTNTPHLHDLELQLDSELQPLLEVLQADMFQRKPLVSRLHSLTIDVVNFYEYSPTVGLDTFPCGPLVTFLEARQNPEEAPKALKRLILYFPDRKDQTSKIERRKIFAELRKLKLPNFDMSLLLRHRGNHKGWRGRMQDFHSSRETMNH